MCSRVLTRLIIWCRSCLYSTLSLYSGTDAADLALCPHSVTAHIHLRQRPHLTVWKHARAGNEMSVTVDSYLISLW